MYPPRADVAHPVGTWCPPYVDLSVVQDWLSAFDSSLAVMSTIGITRS
jgi:hypothetical protein